MTAWMVSQMKAMGEELTDARKTWGVAFVHGHLRNVTGHPRNHKPIYPIYCKLELKLRSEPLRRHCFKPNGERRASD